MQGIKTEVFHTVVATDEDVRVIMAALRIAANVTGGHPTQAEKFVQRERALESIRRKGMEMTCSNS